MAKIQPEAEWSTGLYDCTDDCGNCCMTFWCPCVTFGRVADIVNKGTPSCGTSGALYCLLSSLIGWAWIWSCLNRTNMRAEYNLRPNPCNDCCVHFFCGSCALCQEYRELKNKGYDMKIGWQQNMERQAQGATLPPVIQGGMKR